MGLKEELKKVSDFVYVLPEGTINGQKVPVYFYLSDRLLLLCIGRNSEEYGD